MNADKQSFWALLSSPNIINIIIPIIQRDYAQGRQGQEYVRRSFLKQIGAALGITTKNICGQNDMSGNLDFVYGTVKGKAFFPLDGQQRLTTLWLLHWFVAYRANKLEEARTRLMKFSYETRASARDFCARLCDSTFPVSDKPIIGVIKNQTWFYSKWLQDPTVSAMLTMLGGTNTLDKAGENFIDGIEELFAVRHDDVFGRCWEYLTNNSECSLSFSVLEIDDGKLPTSDDLYVKMNARGRPLTDFENFKAELVEYLPEEESVQIASLIDNDWTDIFWKYREDRTHGDIDDCFFAFLNRYFLNCAIVYESADEHSLAWRLYGDKSDDSKVSFVDFSIYSNILDTRHDILHSLTVIFGRLHGLPDEQKDFLKLLPKWFPQFSFLPKVIMRDRKVIKQLNTAGREILSVTTLHQPERVAFYAICKYFEKCDFDEKSFNRWMRITCNLIENPEIDTVDSMIGRLKLIDELSNHINDIVCFLAQSDCSVRSNAAADQLREEKDKAIQIIAKSRDIKHVGPDENEIIKAEEYAFFKGAIRFLFRREEDGVSVSDWSEACFGTKWSNAQSYFGTEGVKAEYASNARLLRSLIAYFDEFPSYDYWYWNGFKVYCDKSDKESWRQILLSQSPKIVDYVSRLLLQCHSEQELTNFDSQLSDASAKLAQNQLVRGLLLANTIPHVRIRWNWNVFTLYPDNTKSPNNRYLLTRRNELIGSLQDSGHSQQQIHDTPFYRGKDVNFIYNEHKFQWYGNPESNALDVYLMDDDWRYRGRRDIPSEEGTDEDKYFCFRVPSNETPASFKDHLDAIIKEADAQH